MDPDSIFEVNFFHVIKAKLWCDMHVSTYLLRPGISRSREKKNHLTLERHDTLTRSDDVVLIIPESTQGASHVEHAIVGEPTRHIVIGHDDIVGTHLEI